MVAYRRIVVYLGTSLRLRYLWFFFYHDIVGPDTVIGILHRLFVRYEEELLYEPLAGDNGNGELILVVDVELESAVLVIHLRLV